MTEQDQVRNLLAAAAMESGLEDAPLSVRRKQWQLSCSAASEAGHINCRDGVGRTAAHNLALAARDLELFAFAQSAGMDFTIADVAGAQPIHYVADREDAIGGNLLHWLVTSAGASVRASTSDGWTPLHLAAKRFDLERVRTLLKLNASLTAELGDDKWQPLHVAARYSTPQVVLHLLNNGADPGARTALTNMSPADLSRRNQDVLIDQDVMTRLWTGRWPGDLNRRRALHEKRSVT